MIPGRLGLPGGHRPELVADALAGAITTLPRRLVRSLTWDQATIWPNTRA